MIRSEDGGFTADFMFAITLHSATVNVVRWSPNGEYLVSGGDGSSQPLAAALLMAGMKARAHCVGFYQPCAQLLCGAFGPVSLSECVSMPQLAHSPVRPLLHPADRTIVVCHPHPGQSWADAGCERDISRSFLRGHHSDVYDLCWSPDSTHLVSGSVDNTSIVWDVTVCKAVQTLKDHSNFVQGVAWDPRDK